MSMCKVMSLSSEGDEEEEEEEEEDEVVKKCLGSVILRAHCIFQWSQVQVHMRGRGSEE